jgi:hypothetical protein
MGDDILAVQAVNLVQILHKPVIHEPRQSRIFKVLDPEHDVNLFQDRVLQLDDLLEICGAFQKLSVVDHVASVDVEVRFLLFGLLFLSLLFAGLN